MSSSQIDPVYGEYEILDSQSQDAWRKLTLFERPLVHFKDYDQILPNGFLKVSEKIFNFETREDDVWIASQYKSGSTWMGELTWCLLNNLNFETARKDNLDVRMPYLEIHSMSLESQQHFLPPDIIEQAKQNKSPRLLKTHLCFEMLPRQILEKKNKIIYMLRNPRDVCISMYNHNRVLYDYKATLEEHIDYFLAGTGGLYMPHEKNISGFIKNKDLSHILFVTYEEMKEDLSLVIDKVGDFLGLPRLKEADRAELMDHLNIDKMRKNPSVNREGAGREFAKDATFINKGIVGNWKTTLSPENVSRFEKWEQEKLKNLDFKFTYEL